MTQVTKLEKDIEQLRADIIEKDDVLVEAVREKAAGDEDAANDVKRLRGEKKVLQAQLECKTRQLKVSNPCLIICAAFASWLFFSHWSVVLLGSAVWPWFENITCSVPQAVGHLCKHDAISPLQLLQFTMHMHVADH